jgi:hypothetical protein
MHKLTDTDLDSSPRREPTLERTDLPRGGLMPTRVTRHAATMSALLTSARPDRSMAAKDANANPVAPGDGRLVSCEAL